MPATTSNPPSAAQAGPPSILADPSFLTSLVIAVVVALGFGLVVPVLPLFAEDFGVGVFAITGVVSVFAGVRLVSNLYAGSLADRIGARRAVAYGALVVGVSSLLTGLAPGYWWLLIFRGAGGFGSALFFTALLALVVGHVGAHERARAVGLLQGAFLFGLTVGPFAGGVLAEPLGLRGPFFVYAATCLAAGMVALGFLPRPAVAPAVSAAPAAALVGPEGEPGAVPAAAVGGRTGLGVTLRAARRLCGDPAFVAALVMMAASRWSATGVRFSLVPLFASDVVGLGDAAVGYAVGIAAVAQLLVLWPVGRASDLVGRRAVGVPAYAAFGVVAALVGVATTPVAFFVVMVLYGAATGLTSVTPPAVVADVVPPQDTGVGIGVLNTAGDLGSVLGPLASGLLVDLAGYDWGFGAAAALLFVAAVVAARMRETLPRAANVTAAATER